MLLSCLSLFLFACASKNPVTNFQQEYSFGDIEYYSLYPRNSEFTEVQNLGDVMRNRIEIVLEQAMDKKGLDYKDTEQADVVISYYIVGRSARELKGYNREVNYCQYCLTSLYGDNNSSGKKKLGNADYVLPGSLIIDLIDQKKKRSIWRSSYPLNIDVSDNSQEVKEKISNAVNVMFSTLPNK